jgi:hypothetical protein
MSMCFVKILVLSAVIVSLALAQPISPNGRCGPSNGGTVCPAGRCCSTGGWCGDSTAHCVTACASQCKTTGSTTSTSRPSTPVSTNERCGSSSGGAVCVQLHIPHCSSHHVTHAWKHSIWCCTSQRSAVNAHLRMFIVGLHVLYHFSISLWDMVVRTVKSLWILNVVKFSSLSLSGSYNTDYI